jgi:hypothetical protein
VVKKPIQKKMVDAVSCILLKEIVFLFENE